MVLPAEQESEHCQDRYICRHCSVGSCGDSIVIHPPDRGKRLRLVTIQFVRILLPTRRIANHIHFIARNRMLPYSAVFRQFYSGHSFPDIVGNAFAWGRSLVRQLFGIHIVPRTICQRSRIGLDVAVRLIPLLRADIYGLCDSIGPIRVRLLADRRPKSHLRLGIGDCCRRIDELHIPASRRTIYNNPADSLDFSSIFHTDTLQQKAKTTTP